MVEICTLLGWYAAQSGNSKLMFWDNLSVHSSRVKKSKKSLVVKTNCEPEDELR